MKYEIYRRFEYLEKFVMEYCNVIRKNKDFNN